MPKVFGAFTSLLYQILTKILPPLKTWSFFMDRMVQQKNKHYILSKQPQLELLQIQSKNNWFLVINNQDTSIHTALWIHTNTTRRAHSSVEKRKILSVPGILEDEIRKALQEIYCYKNPTAIVPLYIKVYHFNTENVSNIWSFPDHLRKFLNRCPDIS